MLVLDSDIYPGFRNAQAKELISKVILGWGCPWYETPLNLCKILTITEK